MLIKAEKSCLLVIDVQAKLAPVMAAPERAIANIAILMKAAARLDVPMLVSEQYPKGIGHTVEELAALAPEGSVMEKIHFSCMGDRGIAQRFAELGRDQTVIAGIEAHVCVLQTAIDLHGEGRHVFVVADATASRLPENHETAMERLRAAGISIVTTEMVLFEWLGRSGTPEFKEIAALIK